MHFLANPAVGFGGDRDVVGVLFVEVHAVERRAGDVRFGNRHGRIAGHGDGTARRNERLGLVAAGETGEGKLGQRVTERRVLVAQPRASGFVRIGSVRTRADSQVLDVEEGSVEKIVDPVEHRVQHVVHQVGGNPVGNPQLVRDLG